MKHLQSLQSPLRKNQNYYYTQTKNTFYTTVKKTFPEILKKKTQIKQIYNQLNSNQNQSNRKILLTDCNTQRNNTHKNCDNTQISIVNQNNTNSNPQNNTKSKTKSTLLLSTRKYLDLLVKNKSIQRRPIDKSQYYQFVTFDRQMINNDENQQLSSIQNNLRIQTKINTQRTQRNSIIKKKLKRENITQGLNINIDIIGDMNRQKYFTRLKNQKRSHSQQYNQSLSNRTLNDQNIQSKNPSINCQTQRSLASINLSILSPYTTNILTPNLPTTPFIKPPKLSTIQKLSKFNLDQLQKKQQKLNSLRFSFYNNKEKIQNLMQNYNKDECLQKRGQTMYQNVFNRTIAIDGLMDKLKQRNLRWRKGGGI